MTALYLVVTAAMSYLKLLWLDELITLHLARTGSVVALWQALKQGADPNPPGTHLLVMLCRHLFGEHAYVLRMPAMAGYWLGMLSLFAFLKRRVPPVWALLGVVMSMAMGGFEWSYESRSYALFYGTTMAAFYLWSRSAEPGQSRRAERLWMVGCACALAAGLCFNYFAVLAFVPVAVAEAVDTLRRAAKREGGFSVATFCRSLRLSAWAGLALASTPLLLFRPLIRNSIQLYAPHAFNRVNVSQVSFAYENMLAQTIWAFALLLPAALTVLLIRYLDLATRAKVWPRVLQHLSERQPHKQALLTSAEAAGISVLVAYPFLGYLIAKLHGGMFSARFVIPVCFGFACFGCLIAYRAFAAHPRIGPALLTVFLLWFLGREACIGEQHEVQKESLLRAISHIPSPDFAGQRLILGDDLLTLPTRFYSPTAITSRMAYAVDFPAIMRARGEASAETNFWTGRNLYDLPILSLDQMQKTCSSFLILTSGPNWLVDELRRRGDNVERMPVDTEAVGLEFGTAPIAHGKPEVYRVRCRVHP